MFIIKGTIEGVNKYLNRFFWFIDGWCNLIDGIVIILTLGFVCSELTYKFSKFRMKYTLKKKNRNVN